MEIKMAVPQLCQHHCSLVSLIPAAHIMSAGMAVEGIPFLIGPSLLWLLWLERKRKEAQPLCLATAQSAQPCAKTPSSGMSNGVAARSPKSLSIRGAVTSTVHAAGVVFASQIFAQKGCPGCPNLFGVMVPLSAEDLSVNLTLDFVNNTFSYTSVETQEIRRCQDVN